MNSEHEAEAVPKILSNRERTLGACQRRYESGQREALLEAIERCIIEEWPAPAWLKDALWNAFEDVKKSWDEVFGPPFPKGKHRHRHDRNERIGFKLKERIEFLHEKEGRSITQKLFKEVGKEFGVSGSVARNLYYEIKNSEAKRAAESRAMQEEFETTMEALLEAWRREQEGK
jgi:hypothetical protein